MLHTIESDAFKITVSSTGAELHHIYSKKTGVEYLWQGDPAYWGSRAPVLFPIIGGLKNGRYQYNQHHYALSKHGFVRKAYFYKVSPQTTPEGTLVLEYVDNPATRVVYPFSFTMRTVYTVNGNTLAIEYHVMNQSKGEMLFSIGAHEAYRCPRGDGEAFTDYCVEFDRDGLYQSMPVSANGLLTDAPFPVIDNGRTLPLVHELFANDALIFKNIASKNIALKSKKSSTVIQVTYDAPHLGIWTKVGAPFVCFEPWWGLPDYEDTTGMLADKEGIIRLAKGEEKVLKHAITIIE